MHFFPGPAGAKEWTHAAYSPKTELFYVPIQDVGAIAARRRREFKEGIPYWGAGVQVDLDEAVGYLSAFDANGDEKWRWRNELPMCASVLATGGDLVFAGEPPASSTPTTPVPVSCCGSSSAVAAITAAR